MTGRDWFVVLAGAGSIAAGFGALAWVWGWGAALCASPAGFGALLLGMWIGRGLEREDLAFSRIHARMDRAIERKRA